MNTFAPAAARPLSADEPIHRRAARYRLPGWLLGAAVAVLFASLFLPYWRITMYAPQYPDGLTVTTYVDRLGGRVNEVDILNHYIGMKPLEDAAPLERRFGVYLIAAMALLVVAAVWVHRPLAAALALPAAIYPIVFLFDVQFWLADFGLHLDPHAPLNLSVRPFVPHVLGVGHIGQFETVAWPCEGLVLAAVATLFIVAGLWLQRKAYKPLRGHAEPANARGGQRK
ncbi:MAG: cytochrome C [Opitutaceae bacterium]